jgi:hypothetical protein
MWIRLRGEDHRRVVELHFRLARLAMEKGETSDAEELFARYIDKRRQSSSENDWRAAWAEGMRGECLFAEQRYAEAETLFVHSYAILRASDEAPAERKREALQRLIKLHETCGEPREADRYRAQLREVES